jgi:hypothetical protein
VRWRLDGVSAECPFDRQAALARTCFSLPASIPVPQTKDAHLRGEFAWSAEREGVLQHHLEDSAVPSVFHREGVGLHEAAALIPADEVWCSVPAVDAQQL